MESGNMENTQAYSELDRRWRTACRIIFGGEVGELAQFSGWLDGANDRMEHVKSSVSGKEISFGECAYAQGAKRIGFSEIDFGEKFQPLSINEVKDLDSIATAVAERAYYCGNIILGNSKFVERSSNVTDSFYVYNSRFVSDSKYVAYSAYMRYAEDAYGCNNDVYSKMLIRGLDTHADHRSAELYDTYMSPDTYFCSRCEDCHDLMFCFNLKAKSYCIGNFAFSREKYLHLKKKLLEEMREELAKEKKLPSLVEIATGGKDYSSENRKVLEEIAKAGGEVEKGDMGPMEKAFKKTSGLMLGKPLSGVRAYEKWLMRHVNGIEMGKSAASGKPLMVGRVVPFSMYPKDRLLGIREGLKAGEALALPKNEAEGLTLWNATGSLPKIGYFVTEVRLRENMNLVDVALGYNAQNCYLSVIASNVKDSACTFWTRQSEHMFGCDTSFSSSFCMHTYFSNNITRSFEVDASRSCSGSYFLHNCENVQDSMFCFNVKNLRNAIGNAVLPADKFAAIKSALVGQMHSELEKKKELKTGIYNIGAGSV